jgi:hypothetical protein
VAAGPDAALARLLQLARNCPKGIGSATARHCSTTLNEPFSGKPIIASFIVIMWLM